MNEENYLPERVEGQINWFDVKSMKAQRRFKQLRGFEIVAAAAIPLIAGFGGDYLPVELVVGVLGASIVVVSAMISLNQYQENWIEYRTTCETLRQERYLYLAKAEPYQGTDSFALFVRKIENLLSKENGAWSLYTQANVQESKPGRET